MNRGRAQWQYYEKFERWSDSTLTERNSNINVSAMASYTTTIDHYSSLKWFLKWVEKKKEKTTSPKINITYHRYRPSARTGNLTHNCNLLLYTRAIHYYLIFIIISWFDHLSNWWSFHNLLSQILYFLLYNDTPPLIRHTQ